jgi:hypothetical protein
LGGREASQTSLRKTRREKQIPAGGKVDQYLFGVASVFVYMVVRTYGAKGWSSFCRLLLGTLVPVGSVFGQKPTSPSSPSGKDVLSVSREMPVFTPRLPFAFILSLFYIQLHF